VILGFQGGEDSKRSLLGYNAVKSLHPESGGSIVIRNVHIPPQHNIASQPGRAALEFYTDIQLLSQISYSINIGREARISQWYIAALRAGRSEFGCSIPCGDWEFLSS
jgi:hypothetical protein